MFFDGTMYDKAIAELMQRFGNPTLISKSLINKFLEIPAFQDENTSILRLFVDNLHNKNTEDLWLRSRFKSSSECSADYSENTSENCFKVEQAKARIVAKGS